MLALIHANNMRMLVTIRSQLSGMQMQSAVSRLVYLALFNGTFRLIMYYWLYSFLQQL